MLSFSSDGGDTFRWKHIILKSNFFFWGGVCEEGNLLEFSRKQDIAFNGQSKLFCLGVVRENGLEPK